MHARNALALVLALAALGAVLLGGCGASNHAGYDPAATGGAPGEDGGGGVLDTTKDASGAPKPPVVAWLKGKVVAPEGTVPVSKAIVYLTATPPDAIPSGAYCDTCVHLTPLEPYAYTKSDGTFELGAYATGKQRLVVQKGQFRRVREVDVAPGDQSVPLALTRLPGKNDPSAGDTIPRIAMVMGGFDRIDASMKKLGIEEFYRYGDGPFVIGPTPPGIKTGKTAYGLMESASELAGYHIALFPCASLGFQNTDRGNVCGSPRGQTETALKAYVESGGKVYVTDYSYEIVRQTWPGFITWYDDTMTALDGTASGLGTACRAGSETTDGTAEDPGLSEWMKAIGETNIQLKASWTRMQKVTPQPGVDANGKPVTITPKVWMTSDVAGSKLPATVSFEQKCGRVLFSTYHCEGDDGTNLLAQEKALLYVLLEVGVCVGELPPPPPPK